MISRTALITAGSIAVVLVSGSVAMGANLGLIGSSDDGGAPVGQFDLADIEMTATPSTTEVQLTAQDYQVENAGSVSLSWTPGELVLAEATPAEGWTTLVDDSGLPSSVSIGFASADKVYLFTAVRQSDGSVQAEVADVTPAPAPSGPAGSTGSGGGFDDDDGGSDDGGFDDDDGGSDDGGFDDDDGADDGSSDGGGSDDGSSDGGGSDDGAGFDDDRGSGGGSPQGGGEPEGGDDGGGDDHEGGSDDGEDHEDHEYEGGEDDD